MNKIDKNIGLWWMGSGFSGKREGLLRKYELDDIIFFEYVFGKDNVDKR